MEASNPSILGCRFADWSIRLEDPEAIRVFYRWLDHPSCGRRLVSYIRALYELHGLEWSYHDFADELREHSRRVPKLKYDIWDTCASWVLGIPSHSSFLRLALGFTYYLRPKDDAEALERSSFFFHDPGMTAVFTAMLKSLDDAVAAENETDPARPNLRIVRAFADMTIHDEDVSAAAGKNSVAPCPAQLELLHDRVSRRSCSVTGEVDMGVPGAFLEENEFVCELLFSFLSSSSKNPAVVLSRWEHLAQETKYDRTPDQADILGMFFVTHAKISSPLPPERIKSFIDRCGAAELNLRPGPSWGTIRLQKLIINIARRLLESRGHDNGARVNGWLRNRSAMSRHRAVRLHSEVFQVEPAAKEMALLYKSWCKSSRGKEKMDRLLQQPKESLPELLSASDRLFGPEYAASVTNLITAVGPDHGETAHAPDAGAAEDRALLEGIRLKALHGEYQVLRPRAELNSRDASVNELILRMMEDVLDEEPGVRGFVDLPAIHKKQVKLDIGREATIVARKEIGAEVAKLLAALTKLPGKSEVKVREYCTSREQEDLLVCLLRYRSGPPLVEVDVPPFIPEYQLELCKKAALPSVRIWLCGVEITTAVQGMLKDLVDGLALLEVGEMEEPSQDVEGKASEGGAYPVSREAVQTNRKRLQDELSKAPQAEADVKQKSLLQDGPDAGGSSLRG